MYRSANALNVIGYEMLLFMFFLSQQSIYSCVFLCSICSVRPFDTIDPSLWRYLKFF